ncbi:MAG: hypothetical protein KAH18_12980 [Psychromonas sp.]|nr:hypothetical protein [Psychromonas sp.]
MNKKHFIVGGDIKKSLSQGKRLNFKGLFTEALILTKKNYLPLLIACIFLAMIVLVIYGFGYKYIYTLSSNVQLGINFIVSSFIMTPLVTALLMMGIYNSVGIKTKPIDIFSSFNVTIKLAIVNMIINVIVYGISKLFTLASNDIAAVISVFLLIYTNVVFCLTYPLIAEKKMSAYLGLKSSFKIVHKNLLQFIILFMFIVFFAFIAILPYGIGLLVFIPFYFNLMGLVYRETCGVKIIAIVSKSQDHNGTLLKSDTHESANEKIAKPITDKNTTNNPSDTFNA